MTCAVDSGNVTCLLSILTNQQPQEIEELLMSGITPWALAESFGKLDEFSAIVIGNIENQLSNMVTEGQVTRPMADQILSHYKDAALEAE